MINITIWGVKVRPFQVTQPSIDTLGPSLEGAGLPFPLLIIRGYNGWLGLPELENAELRMVCTVRVIHRSKQNDPIVRLGFFDAADPYFSQKRYPVQHALAANYPHIAMTATQARGIYVNRPAIGLSNWLPSHGLGFPRNNKQLVEFRVIALGDTIEYMIDGKTIGFVRRPKDGYQRLYHSFDWKEWVKAQAIQWFDLDTRIGWRFMETLAKRSTKKKKS